MTEGVWFRNSRSCFFPFSAGFPACQSRFYLIVSSFFVICLSLILPSPPSRSHKKTVGFAIAVSAVGVDKRPVLKVHPISHTDRRNPPRDLQTANQQNVRFAGCSPSLSPSLALSQCNHLSIRGFAQLEPLIWKSGERKDVKPRAE